MRFFEAIKRKFQKRHRVIVAWECKRVSLPQANDHPYYYSETIWDWLRDNSEKPVFLCKYDKVDYTPIKKNNANGDGYSAYDTESYAYIKGDTDTLVTFMELEFTSMEDRTLFLLVWSGRVNTVDAITFYQTLTIDQTA